MTRHLMNYIQVVEIGSFLKGCTRSVGDGQYEYLEGHSDKTVADQFGVTKSNVGNLRKQILGDLRDAPRVQSKRFEHLLLSHQALSKKVQEIELMVHRLETDVRQKWDYHTGKYETFKDALNKRLEQNGVKRLV